MKILLDITGATETSCVDDLRARRHCPYLQAMDPGRRWACWLWHTELDLRDTVGDGTGRLLRWPECLAAEKEAGR